MTDVLSHYANEIARKLAADQDALIRRCISSRVGTDWTDATIIPRLRWEQERGRPEKMLLLDDEPLLLIWPPESELGADEFGERHMMKWTVRHQEMP